MAKQKSRYVCRQCGFESLRWLGRCPECGNWNSLEEELERKTKGRVAGEDGGVGPRPLSEVRPLETERLDMGMSEFNRVLGGGLVPGTLVLLAGDPGIGKSTLLMQAAAHIAGQGKTVLFVSGEESAQQIKLRAARMGLGESGLLVWPETDLEAIEEEVRKLLPALVVVDSIQTVYTAEAYAAPGSIGQIREAAARLLHLAKNLHIPIVMVGHVTKDGLVAGPRALEHMVDTVLYFEGERQYQYRVLRANKNRFGSTAELGVFEMGNSGLSEVINPSQAFLAERSFCSPGSVVTACMEGSRPVLVEIQALVSRSSFGQPRRVTAGADFNRVNLIIAILEKRFGLELAGQDAYVNIVGGIRIQEPAVDLGIAIALASSFKNRPCIADLVVMGEVGLTGEVRSVQNMAQRLQEAKKMGFRRCLAPARSFKDAAPEGIEVFGVRTVGEALEAALK